MRKLWALVLGVMLAVTLTAAPAGAADGAVSSSWAELYLADAAVYGLLPDSLRDCDYRQAVSRDEFCQLAYLTLGLVAGNLAYYSDPEAVDKYGFEIKPLYPALPPGGSPFVDTDSPAILALHGAGIIIGKDNGRFAPADQLTRQEAATILGRMAEYCGLQRFSFDLDFADAEQIDSWAAAGVETVCGMGVMVGVSDSAFAPAATFTREQAVATMIRLVVSAPYLGNREEVSAGRYAVFNSMWMWVEDEERQVVFRLPRYWATYNYRPDYGYSGWRFLTHDGKTVVTAYGKDSPQAADNCTQFFDLAGGELFLALPAEAGYFYALSPDGQQLIMERYVLGAEPGDWGTTYYGVYGWDGQELLATTHQWADLYRAGYVNTGSNLDYTWE